MKKFEYMLSFAFVAIMIGCSVGAFRDDRWQNIHWLPMGMIAFCLLLLAGMIVEYLENRETCFIIGLPEPTRPKVRPYR